MIYALLILIITSFLTLSIGLSQRYMRVGQSIAAPGTFLGLLVALFTEGLPEGGIAARIVEWPSLLTWLGSPVYRSDALSGRLGMWCLLLGTLYLWRVSGRRGPGRSDRRSGAGDRRLQGGDRRFRNEFKKAESEDRRLGTGDRRSGTEERRSEVDFRPPAMQAIVGILTITVLYSMVHTWDLRVFVGQILLLVILGWAFSDEVLTPGPRYSLLTMSLGAVCLFGAVLLIGRAMGGEYRLQGLSPSALAQWPLLLLATGSVLWLGLAPLTGWSLRGFSGAPGALVQTLIVGVPVVTLIMRLQGVIATQGQEAGDWEIFMGVLAWVGGLSALVAAAGTIVAAGTPRWESLLGAYTMGMVACALGLDTALGRYAALVILLSFGTARIVLELSKGINLQVHAAPNLRWAIVPAIIVCSSLAAVPLTAGFVGVWLLATAFTQLGHASVAVALAGAVILSGCGVVLHYAYGGFATVQESRITLNAKLPTILRIDTDGSMRLLVSVLGGLALLIAGIAPSLWLRQVAAMASVGGTDAPVQLTWLGMAVIGESSPGSQPLLASAPVLPLAIGFLALTGIGWLFILWMRSGVYWSGVLLPSAARRLQGHNDYAQRLKLSTQPLPASSPVRWLSLLWLEDVLWREGERVMKLGAKAGAGLARLEGRYYMPLTVVLVLVALLAITR